MSLESLADFARAKLAHYGLDRRGWVFAWANAKRRLGVCKFRERRIEVTFFHAMTDVESEVKDTILHEIAHALAGARAGHGPQWQRMAIQVGAKPVRCAGKGVAAYTNLVGRYRATCPECSKAFYFARKPVRDLFHRKCGKHVRACLVVDTKAPPPNPGKPGGSLFG
jgi:predicted SprT family Zn-dependent metalloprotease